jgi:putative tricarboxylic transport membrane protein
VAVSFIGLTVMVVLVSFVGTYISIALFLGFYMRVIGKHSWGLTTATVIGMVLMVYFLFEWQLSKYLPKGLPIFEDGFLWIDNFRWTYLM